MAGLIPFAPIVTSDRDLQLVQNQLQKILGQFTTNSLLTGVLKSVSFTAVDSDVIVPHNLGSLKVGCLVGSLSVPAIIFTSPNKGNANQVILQCETAGVPPWVQSTPYAQGTQVSYATSVVGSGTTQVFAALNGGTSGLTAPPWSVPGNTNDNGITWAYKRPFSTISSKSPLTCYVYAFIVPAQT